MKRLWGLLLVPALAGFARCGGTVDEEYKLTWSDEFEGPAGQAPDPGKWTYDIGTGANGWGNAQLEFDTARPENVSLDGDGHLVITARREDYRGSQYTSARILTRGLFTTTYGRLEARMKLPTGQGLWPAFWTLGANIDEVGWPDCGEIDVMEYRGQRPDETLGSLHGPGYSGGAAITASYTLPRGRFDEDFHVFSVDWDEDEIRWAVDGETWQVATPARLPRGAEWVFDQPHFLILNLAVGGNFVGPPNESTVFPQSLVVDWVRVYERVD